MSESRIWMPIYWGDYLADTTHLTTEQHGAYLLLIGTYWRRGRALPDDDRFLAAATRLSNFRWKTFRKVLCEFFIIRNGFWTHRRVELEILRSNGRSTSARTAGVTSAQRRGQQVTVTVTKKEEELKKEAAGKECQAKVAPLIATSVAALTPQASGPNYDDPKVRKQRWEQKVIDEVRRTKPRREAAWIIEGYLAGLPEAKFVFESVSMLMKHRRVSVQ